MDLFDTRFDGREGQRSELPPCTPGFSRKVMVKNPSVGIHWSVLIAVIHGLPRTMETPRGVVFCDRGHTCLKTYLCLQFKGHDVVSRILRGVCAS